jgi:MFS family permease
MRREPTAAIVLAGSAAFLNLYATQPLLPLFQRVFGASRFAVGLTVTAPTIAVAVAAPMVGRLADTAGLRRVIVGSAFLLAAATALAATAATLWQLIAWRFVQGVVTPGVFAGTIAYIHEVWPASRAGRGTAAYLTGTILGGFAGRVVAGLVAADVNWHASFVVLGVMNAAVAAALAASLPAERLARVKPRAPIEASRAPAGAAPQAAVGDGARGFSRATGELLRNPQLLATYAIGFCVLFTNVAMFTYVTFHLAAPPYLLGTIALGWLFVVYLIGAVVTPFGGRWIDRYGHRAGLSSAMAIGGVGALLTLTPSLMAILAGLALTSTGVFVAQTTTNSYIGAVTTTDRGLAVGLYSTCYYTGGSVGAAAPAALWGIGGWPACVLLVLAVQAAGVAIALMFWKG